MRFSGSILCDCSIILSSSPSRLFYRRRLLFAVTKTKRCLVNPTVVKEEEATYILFSQLIPYLLSMIIYVGMILQDKMLQYLIFIARMDLSSTYYNTTILICKSLVMFMRCF
jgi:hypothetical protein